VRTLTLTQPWATLVVAGCKLVETRSWATAYRGPLAIHAAASVPHWVRESMREGGDLRAMVEAQCLVGDPLRNLGCVLGWVTLEDCVPASLLVPCESLERGWSRRRSNVPGDPRTWIGRAEYALGNLQGKRVGWLLRDPYPLKEPVPARGHLNLWEWTPPTELEEVLRAYSVSSSRRVWGAP